MNADFADSLTLRILPRSRTLAPGASAGGEHGEISFVFAQRLRVSVARLRTVSESEKKPAFPPALVRLKPHGARVSALRGQRPDLVSDKVH